MNFIRFFCYSAMLITILVMFGKDALLLAMAVYAVTLLLETLANRYRS